MDTHKTYLENLLSKVKQLQADKQKLLDIMFEIALTIKDNDSLNMKNDEEMAEWVQRQLKLCGFESKPCGSSWGVLTEN